MNKRYTKSLGKSFWFAHYKNWKKCKISLTNYAKKNNLNKNTFATWKGRFKSEDFFDEEQPSLPDFQSAVILEKKNQDIDDSEIIFYFPNGCYIKFSTGIAEDKLYRILTNWVY